MYPFLKKYKNFLEKHGLLPSFSDESIFFVVVSLVVISIVNPEIRQAALQYQNVLITIKNIVYLGVIATIYTTLFTHFRKQKHKWRMFLFMVTVNILVAAFTINSVLQGQGNTIFLVFPALNIIVALSMLFFWLEDLIDTEMIPNRSANYSHIIYGSIVVALLVLLCQYVFHFSWQTMLSISVVYTCLFNKKALELLPDIFPGRAKKIDVIETLARKAIDDCRKTLLTNTGRLFFCIVTLSNSEVVIVPEHEQSNFADFLHQKMFQQDRTIPYVAVGFYSTITFNHRFQKNKQVKAIRGEVYPQNGKGYMFAELLSPKNGHDAYKGKFIYARRIKNERIDLVKNTAI